MNVTCSFFTHASDNLPKPWTGSWADLVAILERTNTPRRVKQGDDPKKGLPAIAPARFEPQHRGKDEAQSIQLLGLDYDNGRNEVVPGEFDAKGRPVMRKVLIDNPVTLLEVSDALWAAGVLAYQWTTYSNKDGWPKHRALVALSEPVPVALWSQASEWALARLGLLDTKRGLDMGALRDVARIYFLPGHPGGADAIQREEIPGDALAVPLDELPAVVVPPIPAPPHIQREREKRAAEGWAWTATVPIKLDTLKLADLLKAMKVKVGPEQPHLKDGKKGKKWRTHCLWPDDHTGHADDDSGFIIHEPGRWPTWSCSHSDHDGTVDLRDVLKAAQADESIDLLKFAEPHEAPSQEWPTAQPLTSRVDPEPYPIDALPTQIRAAVEEVHGFVKAPFPLVASSAVAAVSLAVQAQHDMKRADRLSGPSGVFLLTIADSGERKSTCDGFFTKAIKDYEAEQAEVAKPQLADYRAALETWEQKRNGAKDAIRQLSKGGEDTQAQEATLRDLEHDKPDPPRVPRLIYADATPEQLKWNLAKAWPSGGVVSSEAGIVFGSHGMGSDSVMRNLATLNQLWDGVDIATDRRTSESFTVRGARLTIALQVQEATLRAFLDQTKDLARGSGFLARFLVALPESTQGSRPFTEAPASWPCLATFNRRISALLALPVPIDEGGGLTPPELAFSTEAKAEWVAFHDRIERELPSGGKLHDIKDVASKTADNAARLAALFHVFEGAAAGGAVGAGSFRSASRVAEWHLNEARRFFGELALPTGLADAARLDSWLIERCNRTGKNEVPTKEVQQYGPSGLREKAVIEAAMLELEELGRAQRIHEGKRKFLTVNPSLLRPVGSATAIPAIPATHAKAEKPEGEGNGSKSSNNSGSNPVVPGDRFPPLGAVSGDTVTVDL